MRIFARACLAGVLGALSCTAAAVDVPAAPVSETPSAEPSPEQDGRWLRAGRALLLICMQQGPDPEKIAQMLLSNGAEALPARGTAKRIYRVSDGKNSFAVILDGDAGCNVLVDGGDPVAALADIDAAFRDLADFATYGPTDAVPGIPKGLEFVGARRLAMRPTKANSPDIVYRFGAYLMDEQDGRRGLMLRRWFGAADDEPAP